MSAAKRKKTKLTPYEKDIEDNLDKNNALPTEVKSREISKLKTAAKNHVQKRRKEQRISIRVFASDLERIKQIAEEEGLPYQTLVTSILHKFSMGTLVSRKSNEIT